MMNFIPKNIFITIPDYSILKDNQNKVTLVINDIKKNYNDFNIYIYDDEKSYQVVKDYGDPILTICYEEILPGAFKSDILRLVLLEKFGGIYIDSGLNPIRDRFLPLLRGKKLVLTEDRPLAFTGYKIWNGFMCSVKNHIFLRRVIQKIKKNISTFNYGINMLDITGPSTVGTIFNQMYHRQKANIKQQYKEYKFRLKSHLKYIYVGFKLNRYLFIEDHLGRVISKPKVRDNIGKSSILQPSKE